MPSHHNGNKFQNWGKKIGSLQLVSLRQISFRRRVELEAGFFRGVANEFGRGKQIHRFFDSQASVYLRSRAFSGSSGCPSLQNSTSGSNRWGELKKNCANAPRIGAAWAPWCVVYLCRLDRVLETGERVNGQFPSCLARRYTIYAPGDARAYRHALFVSLAKIFLRSRGSRESLIDDPLVIRASQKTYYGNDIKISQRNRGPQEWWETLACITDGPPFVLAGINHNPQPYFFRARCSSLQGFCFRFCNLFRPSNIVLDVFILVTSLCERQIQLRSFVHAFLCSLPFFVIFSRARRLLREYVLRVGRAARALCDEVDNLALIT